MNRHLPLAVLLLLLCSYKLSESQSENQCSRTRYILEYSQWSFTLFHSNCVTPKAYAREQTEELARIVAETVATPMEERFARLESLMDVRLAVQTLQLDMRRIKEALHLK